MQPLQAPTKIADLDYQRHSYIRHHIDNLVPPRSRFGAPPSTFGDDNTSIFRSPDVRLLEGSVDPLQLLLCTAFHLLPFVGEVVVIRLSVVAVVHI
jgi:hypothetical protein